MGEMLRDLLGNDASLSALGERIRERTGGNPFFIEEVVQSLVETGNLLGTRGSYRLARTIEQSSIPRPCRPFSRQGSIDWGAREDDPSDRSRGREGVLRADPRASHRSCRGGAGSFIANARRRRVHLRESDLPGAEYAFKHPLTQEVAYGSPLAERRALTHAAVARAIAELYPEKIEERAALLAHHWECAGDGAEAARWHARAAEWAGANDPGEALRHWTKVRDLVGKLPESEILAPLALEARTRIITYAFYHGLSEDGVKAIFIEGRALATRIKDPRALAKLLTQYGWFIT